MDNSNCWSKPSDAFWRKAGAVVLVGLLIFYLSFALIRWERKGYERSSFVLPAISLLDHGSFRIDEDDVETAGRMFPEDREYYREHYAENLPVARNGDRYPFYLGIFTPLCIPAFWLFQSLDINPGYAFPLMNALIAVLALWVVYRFAKLSEAKKLLAILLLGLSPIIVYLGWWEYEMAMYAFVVTAMVFWFNKWRKLAALFLSLAGTINSTIMAFGFFMILDYFLDMLAESGWSVRAFFRRFAADWKKTAGLAACFLPCLVPFVISYIGMGCWYTQENMELGSLQGIGGRFLAYLFDLNLGLFPYLPVMMFLFAAITVWGGVHGKRYDMLCTFFGTLAVIAAYSIMSHINCGMSGMARYNAWIYPIIALGAVYYTDIAFSGVKAKRLSYGLTVMSCLWCCFIVGITACSPHSGISLWWTPVAETVLEYAPGLYDPLPSTFYSRNLHIDGGYDITEPAYYLDQQTNEVRKLLYKADEGQAERVLNELKGDERSVAYLKEKLEDNGVDGKFHYIDFSPFGAYHLTKTTPEERGELAEIGVVTEGHDLTLENDGNCLITMLPVTIKDNTIYKIEVAFEDSSALPDASKLYVDFCGPGYDNIEQEARNFVKNGIYSYTFYFDSGTIDSSSLDAYVRVFSADMSLPLAVKSLRVTEMERLN